MRNGRGSGPRGSRLGSLKDDNVIDDQMSDEGHPDVKTAEKSLKKQTVESHKDNKPKDSKQKDTAQIEYLIHQSTQGVHFLFDKKDVSRVMMVPTDEKDFFTMKNMERVQSLLSRFLGKPTLNDKERFLRSLTATERDLMIRAYFHLVENAIRSNSELSH
jgi:hypothetical protein